MHNRLRVLALYGALAFGCGGGDGGNGSVTDPAAGATVSGVVREQGSGVPVAGALITLGGISATSGQNGEFELRNVPTGTGLNATVNAPGYDAFTQSVSVQSGSNNLTFTIVRNGLYSSGNYLLYLPPNVSTYRGVFVVMHGGAVDTRQLVRGDVAYYQQFPLSGDVAGYRQRMIELAQSHGLAVMGGAFTSTTPTDADYTSVISALNSVATQSGHPELSAAPLLLHGHSARACVAYYFAATHPERTIGFIVAKGGCPLPALAADASVPSYFFYGQNDPQWSTDLRPWFEQNRSGGAQWAYAVEPGAGHAQVEDQNVLFDWLSAVVTLRLAAGSATLRSVAENVGWLGDRSSYAIAPYACFAGNKTAASWLPNEQTAREWQSFVSRGVATTVTLCGSAN